MEDFIESNQRDQATGNRRNIEHSQTRAKERYGLELSSKDINILNNIIQSELSRGGNNGFILKTDFNTSLWKINYQGRNIFIIYDNRINFIRTILSRQQAQETINDAQKIPKRKFTRILDYNR
jgi:hypothetical protein